MRYKRYIKRKLEKGSNKKRPINLMVALLIVLYLQAILMPLSSQAAGEENESETDNQEIIEEQLKQDKYKELEKYLKQYTDDETGEIIEDFDPVDIFREGARGNFKFSFIGLLNSISRYLFREIYSNINIMAQVIILAVLCALLKNLQTSFLSESVGELAFFACYIVIVSIMVESFYSCLNLATAIVENMVNFMYATMPVLITLLVSGGNITAGGVFQPIVFGIIGAVATIIKSVLMPVILLSTILALIGNISEKVQLSKLTGTIKQVTTAILGLILTVFIGIITIQGSVGAIVDGVTGKTAKFAISTFVPVAGKYLADAAETVIGCALVIKNAAGVAVMAVIVAICLVPILKITALIFLYKITCVLIEPVSEKRITKCIDEISSSLTYIIGLIVSVAFMFIISVTAIIAAGNISTMIR
ncbi:MAG TPA: stage III sporulation protein AE [Clostridiaceae bacterium]|nr:stage III sporulation protein AE [Clostridiaceae bacterium]